jgi:urea transport system substrate-binding protein
LGDKLFTKVLLLTLLLSVLGVGVSFLFKPTPILVGVLHSQTGTMSFSEKGVLAATLAAIDDVNSHGGVLGRPLQAVVADGKSDEHVFAQQAEQLLAKDKVAVIFGGWTSASRKAMLPVLAAHDALLFYPVQYEGIEESPYVIYTGMTPNQQLYPALTYMTEHLGKKVVLVGSDYIYPRMANAIATPVLKGLGADICAEVYAPLGSDDMSAVTKALARCKPDFILNTVNGDSNLALFKALAAEPKTTPVMSLSLAEPELRQLITSLGESATREHYTVWGYFQSLATADNEQMLMQLHRTLGNAAINNPMKSAWDGVHLWANAAKLSGLLDAATLSKNIAGMSYSSATGVVSVDINNHHLWQRVYIGKANAKGQFDLVWQSQLPVSPLPWPTGHSPQGWQKQEQNLYQQWGGQWQAP